MEINRSEIKERAKGQITGKIGMFFVCGLLLWVISAGANVVPLVGAILVSGPMMLGFVYIQMDVSGGQDIQVGRLFEGFYRFGQAVILYLLITVFTFLWTLLFIVPGIIKAISYSMAFYILAENPDMTAQEALDESKKITMGYKGQLFVLYLSFIPWILLCTITLGIAYIYVAPYMQMTSYNFYQKIKTA